MAENRNDLPQITHTDELLPLLQTASEQSAHLQRNADATCFARFNREKSHNTLKAYRQDLQRFGEAWLGETCSADFGQYLMSDPIPWFYITYGEVTAFVLWMQEAGYALSTVNRSLYVLRTYARQAMLSGVMPAQQYARIEGISGYDGKVAANVDERRVVTRRDETVEQTRVKKATATHIPQDLLDDLLYAHNIDTLKGLRDAVLFNLLLQLGLRASEVAELKWHDINLEQGEVRFYRRKVAKTQTMGLSMMLQSLLRLYMRAMPVPHMSGKLLYGVTRGDKVGKNGLSAANISMIVKRFGQSIGLPTLSAHDLRHHWTTTLHQRGVDTLTLQRMGGWKSPRMLQRYVAEKARVNEGLENPYHDEG
ncbi:MAG: site-specific integrase [Chloroflexota bacterium]